MKLLHKSKNSIYLFSILGLLASCSQHETAENLELKSTLEDSRFYTVEDDTIQPGFSKQKKLCKTIMSNGIQYFLRRMT